MVVGDKVGEDEADEAADELNGRAGMMCDSQVDRRKKMNGVVGAVRAVGGADSAVEEVVRGLYEGSSLASIPSCNEFRLKLWIGYRVADVLLLRERAADDRFIRG